MGDGSWRGGVLDGRLVAVDVAVCECVSGEGVGKGRIGECACSSMSMFLVRVRRVGRLGGRRLADI